MKKVLVIGLVNLAILAVLLLILEFWAKAGFQKLNPNIAQPIQLIYLPDNLNGFENPTFNKEKPDSIFRILCLGGSTSQWANYTEFISWAFRGQPYVRTNNMTVQVYSAGFEAHTSLDSYYKYKYLYDGYDFDLVILYHGVNDLRANNCPPEMFRDDYSHFSYYSVIDPIMKLQEIPVLKGSFLALKISLMVNEKKRKAMEKANPRAFVDVHDPDPDWMQYGVDVKTTEPFRRNTQAIVDLAKKRGQRVLLMTFAYNIPENYSREALLNGELDFGEGVDDVLPVEMFGTVEAVNHGLETHNRIITEIADKERTYFIDQKEFLGPDIQAFIDLCHFSQRGINRFAGKIGNYFIRNRFKPAAPKN